MTTTLRNEWIDAVHYAIKPYGNPILVSIKGSRLWGINEPDADVDLRVVYQAPTIDFFRFTKPQNTIERTILPEETPDGLKYDIVAHEVGHFLALMLKHNGNITETAIAPPEKMYIYDSRKAGALRELGNRYLTKELYKFFRGYALNQFLRAAGGGSAKRGGIQARTGKNLIACLTPGHRVLTNDLRWVRVEDLRIGDGLFAFTENRPFKFQSSVVTQHLELDHQSVYQIILSDGTELRATDEHQWLVLSDEQVYHWVRTDSLIGKRHFMFRRLINTWDFDVSHNGGGCLVLLMERDLSERRFHTILLLTFHKK